MQYHLRALDSQSPDELHLVTERCMETVLETIPEFEGRIELARAALPNFSHEEMSAMIRSDLYDANKRLMVAVAGNQIVGQALYSVKQDEHGVTYGFCYSRYVHPDHRKQGVATALLRDALAWFTAMSARYAIAHTHVTNVALQRLFLASGFSLDGPFEGRWPYYLLKKQLP
jgi:GNAT superfamily N-acetyltransferase